MGTRKGRGPARGHKLDIFVKRHGKYKIVFASGETIPMEFEAEFATGVGIVIRTNADIRGVSHWREVPEENKEVCYARLFQWFDIEGWHTDERVNKIIDDKFQVPYTRWRNILHQEYKKLVDQGINPREVCPRPDLSMAKWQVACDFIQDEKYQENMVAMQSELIDGNEDQPSEDVIMRSALGHRSGYLKGMGHGVEVVKHRQSCPSVVGNAELRKIIRVGPSQ
ncbi:hypothetical protein Salat_1414400 [Sesamum alatum]|uniref:Transposase n=1 Tax=Sesamum alatum TaxID=300844 RepID=A0AAE1YA64_9LAMI|nr:hypothetical protein Salat_1414400 [Sesamum alatum]